MNPIDVANVLRSRYISYLTTTFGLSTAFVELDRKFDELISQREQLVKGPFLEATAPYRASTATLESLTAEGVLHPEFTSLFTAATAPPAVAAGFGFGMVAPTPRPAERERLPRDRKLYVHQEEALKRLCRSPESFQLNRHTVVASGTGSGKTECFLLPTFDWILRHPTRKPTGQPGAGHGIRALLVYPMNALVNDQIRRLRQLVGYWPDRSDTPIPITFARYTSETEDKNPTEARKHEPNAPENQLLTRQRIIEEPPDILITNFAMLEQALLRPQEVPFFEKVDEHAWRFLILDEAHNYRGAQAIELARLMQRLRAAVLRGKRRANVPPRPPICVATSATLADPNDPVEVRSKHTAEFAGKLFGMAKFQNDGVVFAEREDPQTWGQPWDFDDADSRLQADRAWARIDQTALADLQLPANEPFWKAFSAVAPSSIANKAREDSKDDRGAFLFHLLKGHPRFHWLWQQIRNEPRRFEPLAESWEGLDPEEQILAMERLVAACNAARRLAGEQPLLPCRYHLFASALEGLFVDLAADGENPPANGNQPWSIPELKIREVAVRRISPEDRAAFEIARCDGCHYPFVVVDENPAASMGLDQPPAWERPVRFLAFRPDAEDATALPAVRVSLQTGEILSPTAAANLVRTLFEVNGNTEHTDVQECPHCGRKATHHRVAGRFQTGQDAPVSALTEALYEQLPPLTPKQTEDLSAEYAHRRGAGNDPIVGGGRKLLMFSDSRQNAAFMASYLQDHCRDYLLRELAWDAMPKTGDSIPVVDWANAMIETISARCLLVPYLEDRDLAELGEGTAFHGSYKSQPSERRTILLHALLSELTGTQPLVLESLGLLRVHIPVERLSPGEPTQPFFTLLAWLDPRVTIGSMRELLDRFFRLMRRQYIVTCPDNVVRPGFSSKQAYLILEKTPEVPDNCRGVLVAQGRTSMFTELVRRWLTCRMGSMPSEEQVRAFLSGFWKFLMDRGGELFATTKFGNTPGIALRHDVLEVVAPSQLWQCDRCDAYSTTFLDGICPEPSCDGRLREIPSLDSHGAGAAKDFRTAGPVFPRMLQK